jgi:DNA replication licensing factor MCM2
MTYKKDYNELLLLLLRTLVKDALHFEEIVSGSTTPLTHVEVKVDDLKNKVRARNTFARDSYLAEQHHYICLLSVPEVMVL